MISHSALNSSTAENRIRSAKAPTISAGVMIAKVIWNMKNSVSGIVPLTLPASTPLKNALERSPTTGVASSPELNARL